MDFKEYAKRELLKEAYGDDNSEENLGLKNSKEMEDIAKENSQDPPMEDDEEMEEAEDSELEEEVFALQSQCDNVMKSLEVLKKMLNEGPEWALNKVSALTNQFSKFQQNLTRDEKNTKKEGGYTRTKDEVSPNGGNNELKKESFDPMLTRAIGILDYVPKAIAVKDNSLVGDALKYL